MNPFVEPLALEALEAALRWTVPFGVVWLAARARPLSAAARHHLWAWLLAGLLALPLASAAVPAWEVRKPRMLRSVEVAISSLPASAPRQSPLSAAALGSGGAVDAAASEGLRPPAPVREPNAGRPVATALGVGGALSWLWLLVAAVLLLVRGSGQIAVHRLARGSRPAARHLVELLEECTGRLGVRRPVRLLIAADAVVPMTWGTLRPSIVLPAASTAWPREQLRRVLLHEAAHVARLDSLTNTMTRHACAVFWFHPGVWYAARTLRQEAESACDDRVVDAGVPTVDYASDLLEISRTLRPGPLASAALPMAQPGGLAERIRRLLDRSRRRGLSRRAAGAVLLGLAVLVAAVAGVGWARGRAADDWLRQTRLEDGRPVWTMDCGRDEDPICADATRRAMVLLERAGRPGVIVAQRVSTGEVVTYAAVRPSGRRGDAVPLVLPGSVAKLGLAALWWESGMGDGPIPCPGQQTLESGRIIRNAGARDLGTMQGPRGMLVASCNTAAALMTRELEGRLGSDAFARDLVALGFGAPGVPLAAETDPDFWARADSGRALARPIPQPRFSGTGVPAEDGLVLAALGHGEGGTTPLHVSRFLQAVGNRGVMLPPRPVASPGSRNGGVRLLSEATGSRLRAAMLDVVREGTASRALPQLEWSRWALGGKTGTVPGPDGALNGWFAGLAHTPDGRAAYTIVVLVEDGGAGGGVPAGIAAEMTRLFARAAGDEL